jgi:hypothetical protein
MGYKLLGMAVWKLVRLYVRRRYPDAPRKLAIGAGATAVGAAVAGGIAVAVERRQRPSLS